MVRVAFVVDEDRGLGSRIAERFGRGRFFLIVDVVGEEPRLVGIVENPGASAGSGAGVRAVQKLIDEGVRVVVGPSPGPNAYMALQQAGIRHVLVAPGTSAEEALKRLLGELGKD